MRNSDNLMKLAIAVPTYNRAARLQKALLDLCAEINSANHKADVAVFVSNNGSSDDTSEVIMRCGQLFIENGIPFSSRTSESNQGFDANLLACYAGCSSEYVWFLSDDDNIISGAVDAIINNLTAYQPSVIFYNHNQKPYDQSRPYIERLEFFEEIVSENLYALKKIIFWPKLTSMVIKKCESGLKVPNLNSGFAHIALALQCSLGEGGVLHSPVFTACPDSDYEDHIDYVPYIFNNLNIPIRWALQANNRMCFYQELCFTYTDPLCSSLNTLGAYYRGQHALTLPLKRELWETLRREIKCGWLKRLRDWKLVKELFKFPMSLAYGVGYTLIVGKGLVKNRSFPSDP